ncbi:MAG TPA: hypothetical protein VFH99_03150 [Candidatus Saccharimonadales bacterium]|nr:hypothetical protein [Candidatus Saccharimonadales bacterium]
MAPTPPVAIYSQQRRRNGEVLLPVRELLQKFPRFSPDFPAFSWVHKGPLQDALLDPHHLDERLDRMEPD